MLIESDTLENIADAIRDQTGENNSYTPTDMPAAIRSIQGPSVALTFDDIPIQGSDNPVKSGGIYNALQNLNIPAEQIQSDWNQTSTSAKDYIKNKPNLTSLLASKQNDLTQVSVINSIESTDYLFIERNGIVYKALISVLLNVIAENSVNILNTENENIILTENGNKLAINI